MDRPIKEDGERVFLEAMMGSYEGKKDPGSDAIVASEKRGQRQLVASETLPTKINGGTLDDLKSMGIVLGEPFDDDPLFAPATLPGGWTKAPTDHDMWSKVLDDKGRERAAIFYKAAFYDRDAFINLSSRFRITVAQFVEGGTKGDEDTVVIDSGVVPPVERARFDVPAHPKTAYGTPEMDNYYAAKDVADGQAKDWLEDHYPNWKHYTGHWDED